MIDINNINNHQVFGLIFPLYSKGVLSFIFFLFAAPGQLFVTILLIFMVTDLMTCGMPLCLHVSHRMRVFSACFCSVSSGEPLRLARPHWLNHQPVWLCRALQLSTVRLWMEQEGLQPSLSTSGALNGAVSWFCSCS